MKGTVLTVDSDLIERLNGYIHYRGMLDSKNDERADQDAWRFKDLKPLKATVTLDRQNAKPISDNFIGIFFEDINYGADGGLYAELIQNRDFEYSAKDRKEWTPLSSWESNDMDIRISNENPIHPNNSNFALVKTGGKPGLLSNSGFDGIVLKKGDRYFFSLFARSASKTTLKVSLTDKDGKTIAQGKVNVGGGNEWAKLDATLTAKADCSDAMLRIEIPAKTEVSLDPEFRQGPCRRPGRLRRRARHQQRSVQPSQRVLHPPHRRGHQGSPAAHRDGDRGHHREFRQIKSL